MITLTPLYIVVGVLLLCGAFLGLRERAVVPWRRVSRAAFWGLLSLAFLVGDRLPAAVMGGLVIALALLAALSGTGHKTASAAAGLDARGLKNRLFIPALLIPVLTLLGVFLLKPLRVQGQPLLDPNGATLICLGLGCAGGPGRRAYARR